MSFIRATDNQRKLEEISAPDYITNPVVPLEDLKNWLRLDTGFTDDDDLLLALQQTAVMWIEDTIWRKLAPYQLRLTLDHFPGYAPVEQKAADWVNPSDFLDFGIVLHWTPTSAVDQFDTVSDDGTKTTLTVVDDYDVDLGSQDNEARIMPPDGDYRWYVADNNLRNWGALEITYTTGYDGDVPGGIITAIKYLVAHMYENRGDCGDCGECAEACGAKMVLQPYMPVY